MSDEPKTSTRLLDNLRRRIPEEHLSFTFTRSGGPGGQNVNKVSTRVTLRFDLAGSGELSEHEKRTLLTRLAGRVTKDGHLRVVSMRHRTQLANRRAATERFYELLAGALAQSKPRKRTRMPRAARERRLRDKAHRSLRKQERSGGHRDE